MKEYTLREIAHMVDGELVGPPDGTVKGIAPLDSATEELLSFAVSKRLKEAVDKTKAACLLLPTGWPFELKRPAILVKDPYLAFAKVLSAFTERPFVAKGVMDGAYVGEGVSLPQRVTIYPGAFVGDGAVIGEEVVIYPGAYLGEGVVVGDGTIIYPNVTIYAGCSIGRRCILHAGAVVGSDGFGFAQDGETFYKIPQVGRVVIEDDCEIGANTTIDRATLGETRIKRGTKIDNLVQIAHNCEIGPNSVLVSQVGIAGSTRVGANCMLGGQVGVVGHIKIGDRVKIGAQSGVAQDVPDDSVVSGSPAIPHREWLRISALIKRLPELFDDIRRLKKTLSSKGKEGS